MNESGTFSPDCKYNHMLENGAPPDKFGVLYRLLHLEFHDFNTRIDVNLTQVNVTKRVTVLLYLFRVYSTRCTLRCHWFHDV